MGGVITRPRSVVRRGMKRTVEDLESNICEPEIHNICEKHVDDWTAEEEALVQGAIDQFKTA